MRFAVRLLVISLLCIAGLWALVAVAYAGAESTGSGDASQVREWGRLLRGVVRS